MEDTNWSSIDLYYKGFHIKKSWPEDKDAEALKGFVDKAIELGFEPSWNTETNSNHDPIMKATQGMDMCPIHHESMKRSKTGKLYHMSVDETQMCMGKGWFELKK